MMLGADFWVRFFSSNAAFFFGAAFSSDADDSGPSSSPLLFGAALPSSIWISRFMGQQ